MTLPLTARERRVGVMTLAHGEPGYYTCLLYTSRCV